jgi:sugar phosphate isomerase/epimerase
MNTRRELLRAGGAFALLTRWSQAAEDRKSIQIGCCVPPKELQAAATAGFDYIEPAAADIAALTPPEFGDLRSQVSASPIRCDAFNSFIRRKDLVVVGPSVDLGPVKEYVDSTLDRCRQLGAKIVVWGSAGSRNVPEGFSREKAWDQIAVYLQAIAPIAARHEVVISIEPLNRKESNILNTGHETLRMVDLVNRPEIRMIIDYYHLRLENESLSIFEEAGSKINHLHFARPEGRLWPATPDEDSEYVAFFGLLHRLRWRGGLSIEGKGSVEANGKQSLAFLRSETEY